MIKNNVIKIIKEIIKPTRGKAIVFALLTIFSFYSMIFYGFHEIIVIQNFVNNNVDISYLYHSIILLINLILLLINLILLLVIWYIYSAFFMFIVTKIFSKLKQKGSKK